MAKHKPIKIIHFTCITVVIFIKTNAKYHIVGMNITNLFQNYVSTLINKALFLLQVYEADYSYTHIVDLFCCHYRRHYKPALL